MICNCDSDRDLCIEQNKIVAYCQCCNNREIIGTGIDIHKIIGKLPKPKGGWTLPGHKYTGPWNPLHQQLDENDNPLPGQEPYNQVDAIAMRHDICYRDHENSKSDCDKVMLDELRDMEPTNLRERFDRRFVQGMIGAKYKLGLGKKVYDDLAVELHRPKKKSSHDVKLSLMV